MENNLNLGTTQGISATVIAPSQNDSIQFSCSKVDIDESGVRVRIASKIMVGNNVVIKLRLPSLEGELNLNGEVAWVLAVPGKANLFETGIKFSVLGDHDKQQIRDYIEQQKKPKIDFLKPVQDLVNKSLQQTSVRNRSEFILIIVFSVIFFALIFSIISYFVNRAGIWGIHF